MEHRNKKGGVTGWIIRFFIHEHPDRKRGGLRKQYGNLSSIVGIVVNVLLFAVKFTVGTLSASVSIVGDAVNNLSDAGSSVISFISFKLSAKPADNDHPFGHARIEYIASSLVAVVILFIGFELIKTSVDKVLHPVSVSFGFFTVCILSISILAKLWLYQFNRKLAKQIHSTVIYATAADSLSDVLATSAVFISAIISRLSGVILDGYMGIAVSVLIMFSGIQILRETMNHILGQGPSEELIERIQSFILKYDGVIGIHDLVVHDYGPQQSFASVHVEVDANTDIMESHDLIDNIERDIALESGIHLVIHMDPIVTDDPFVNEMQKMTEEVVVSVDETLSIHDFRVVKGATHHNLIFDVTVPYDCKKSDKQVLDEVVQKIEGKHGNLYAVITIDRSFISAPNKRII